MFGSETILSACLIANTLLKSVGKVIFRFGKQFQFSASKYPLAFRGGQLPTSAALYMYSMSPLEVFQNVINVIGDNQ